jgi:hypothetical protein
MPSGGRGDQERVAGKAVLKVAILLDIYCSPLMAVSRTLMTSMIMTPATLFTIDS